jgi:hypothetical protein
MNAYAATLSFCHFFVSSMNYFSVTENAEADPARARSFGLNGTNFDELHRKGANASLKVMVFSRSNKARFTQMQKGVDDYGSDARAGAISRP